MFVYLHVEKNDICIFDPLKSTVFLIHFKIGIRGFLIVADYAPKLHKEISK